MSQHGSEVEKLMFHHGGSDIKVNALHFGSEMI